MKKSLLRLALTCSCLALSTAALKATVVTGNNLSSVALADLTSAGSQASLSISVAGSSLYVLKTTVASTATGLDMAPYYVVGVSGTATPTATTQLYNYVSWARTNGAAYPSTTQTFAFTTAASATKAYLNLGMGRFDAFGSGSYNWAATGNVLYSALGTNGNLVPNCSFENTNVSFWTTAGGGTGGAYVSDLGKQGSTVWQITGAADSHIAVPVIAGAEYAFSFWVDRTITGNGAQIEYGSSVPLNGFSIGTGNTAITRYAGDGTFGWTEYSGTFTAAADQTTWYLGGMTNGGAINFDSISVVAVVPEPHTMALLAVGGILVLARRRYVAKRAVR